MLERMLDGEAQDIHRAIVQAAKAGDPTAMRLLYERLNPPGRGRSVSFELPPLATIQDVSAGYTLVIRAAASGELTLAEATALADILEGKRKSLEHEVLQKEIDELKLSLANKRGRRS